MTPTREEIDEFDEGPRSAREREADAEQARMDLLGARIDARMLREDLPPDELGRVMDEERERLRRERGEPEPEEDPDWEDHIDELNEAALEAMEELASEAWKDDPDDDPEPHPLITRCREFAVRLHDDIDDFDALPEHAHAEHPLREIVEGVMLAGSKLAGALGSRSGPEDWPPPALLAGDPLVRLKKARGLLCDALRGLDSADAENLATKEWRDEVRREVDEILTDVLGLIRELRQVLADDAP